MGFPIGVLVGGFSRGVVYPIAIGTIVNIVGNIGCCRYCWLVGWLYFVGIEGLVDALNVTFELGFLYSSY